MLLVKIVLHWFRAIARACIGILRIALRMAYDTLLQEQTIPLPAWCVHSDYDFYGLNCITVFCLRVCLYHLTDTKVKE